MCPQGGLGKQISGGRLWWRDDSVQHALHCPNRGHAPGAAAEVLRAKHAIASSKSYVDYGLYAVLGEETLDHIDDLIVGGIILRCALPSSRSRRSNAPPRWQNGQGPGSMSCISHKDELRPLAEAKARGIDITGETGPDYLMPSTEDCRASLLIRR